jgi:hypothetical protein
VDFDPTSYTAWQDGAHFAPWWAKTDLRVVVFDTPFVDLRRARNTRGIVSWGSHSPGIVTAVRPAALLPEFVRRFGEYPAVEWTYATPWASAADARLMGEGLSKALDVRSRAAYWLAARAPARATLALPRPRTCDWTCALSSRNSFSRRLSPLKRIRNLNSI